MIYANFDGWMDFTHLGSCIGKGLLPTGLPFLFLKGCHSFVYLNAVYIGTKPLPPLFPNTGGTAWHTKEEENKRTIKRRIISRTRLLSKHLQY